jgi:hypothetical protein
MEFILVAHAIIVGLAVSEILRGFSELFRSNIINISYRLLLIAVWTLLILLQVWWAVWHVGGHAVWTFSEFLLFLLPVGILYMIARLCFPAELNDADLDAYYSRVAQVIWWLVAATYASFAFLMAPFVYGGINPPVFASQIGLAVLALVASRVKSPSFQVVVIIVMLAQVMWRGISYAIGS